MIIVFLDLVLLIIAALAILAFVTQVAIPLFKGTPMFPFFRKSSVAEQVADAQDELEEVAELEELSELQQEINRRKAQLKKETE